MSVEEKLRQKDAEVAELKTLEQQTRDLAVFFEDLHADFGRINKTMAGNFISLLPFPCAYARVACSAGIVNLWSIGMC